MFDLGIKGKGSNNKSDDYAVKWLNECEPDEKYSGEIYIGEIKEGDIKGKSINKFYVIVTDHKNEQKLIADLITSWYQEDGNIYGEKDGRVYELIDSVSHVLNKTPLEEMESYSVNFDTFRSNINNNIDTATIQVVKPKKPTATNPNIIMTAATLLPEDQRKQNTPEPVGQQDLVPFNISECNEPNVRAIYDMLKAENKVVSVPLMQQKAIELNDEGSLTHNEWLSIRKELKIS